MSTCEFDRESNIDFGLIWFQTNQKIFENVRVDDTIKYRTIEQQIRIQQIEVKTNKE